MTKDGAIIKTGILLSDPSMHVEEKDGSNAYT